MNAISNSYITKHGGIKILHVLLAKQSHKALYCCIKSIIGRDVPNDHIALFKPYSELKEEMSKQKHMFTTYPWHIYLSTRSLCTSEHPTLNV